ncbi:MAG: bifunctional (p)ppGpp synthetase/guanosine-3',5'-bis(diphosphate) 3'-pyrophosphohydrolase [Gammaproteobacteria bacterium]|jgi:RelA/SpoT family (p)ppGpp synthetase
MSEFLQLQKKLRSYLPKKEIKNIRQAFLFAENAHKQQTRVSGKPYITHPIAVGSILADMRLDSPSIIAAILHDTIEDTGIDKQILEEHFSQEVAKLVDGVSKLEQIQFESRAKAQAENFRKMVIAMVGDIRVILIKLADRLHNMRTLEHLPPEKRQRIAKETLEIYAPIANRLGMNNFRLEFENRSFAMLNPWRYAILNTAIRRSRGNRKELLRIIHSTLNDALKKAKLKHFKLWGREKHIYSIYKKMKEKKLKFSEVMDIYAFRAVFKTVGDCYRALGVLHNLYKPVPEKFKDYIAIPKVNGYQSLHTVLFGPYGVPIEIQIRTEEMNKMAESGIAAHWLYKSKNGGAASQAQLRARAWIQELLEIQQNAGDSLEFIENVKTDLFPDAIYVFTPQGEIMELPNGATPVDFAYAVHSDIGDTCMAVNIDGRSSPLSTQLINGQKIEIITSPNATPKPNWLDFVVTGKARSHIRNYLKNQQGAEAIKLGRRLLENVLEMQNTKLSEIPAENVQKVLRQSNYKTEDALYKAIGLGNQFAQLVAQRLLNIGELKIGEVGAGRVQAEPLSIKGSEGMVISFAKCCYPIPGDPISGVLTAGHGLVVHNARCKNLTELSNQPDKCVPLRWANEVHGDFETELDIEISNQRGALASIALAIAEVDSNISTAHMMQRDAYYQQINVVITVQNRDQLAQVMRRIRQLNNVVKVTRVQG